MPQRHPAFWPKNYTSMTFSFLTWNVHCNQLRISDLKRTPVPTPDNPLLICDITYIAANSRFLTWTILQWPSELWHEKYIANNSRFMIGRHTTANSGFLAWKAHFNSLRLCNSLLNSDMRSIPEHVLTYSNEIWVLEQNNNQQHSATIWLWHDMTWNEGSVVKLT